MIFEAYMRLDEDARDKLFWSNVKILRWADIVAVHGEQMVRFLDGQYWVYVKSGDEWVFDEIEDALEHLDMALSATSPVWGHA